MHTHSCIYSYLIAVHTKETYGSNSQGGLLAIVRLLFVVSAYRFSSCRTLYLLGYIPKENRLYLGDKELNVVSYELLVSVLEYQTAVMRRDFTTADRVLPTIPPAHRTRVAHFLEKQGFKKQALAVSTDPEHK